MGMTRGLNNHCHWTPMYKKTEDRWDKADPIFQENHKAKRPMFLLELFMDAENSTGYYLRPNDP